MFLISQNQKSYGFAHIWKLKIFSYDSRNYIGKLFFERLTKLDPNVGYLNKWLNVRLQTLIVN